MKKFKNKQTIKFTAAILTVILLFTIIPFSVSANILSSDFVPDESFEILESGALMTFTIDEHTGEMVHLDSGTLISEDSDEFSENTDSQMRSNDEASLTYIVARYSDRVEVTFWYFTTNVFLHGSSVNVTGTFKVDGHVGVSPNAPAYLVNQTENFNTSVSYGTPKTIKIYLAAHHINERVRMDLSWTYGTGNHDAIVNWGYITTNWHPGTYPSVLSSVNDHYIKHRQDFGAINIVEFCNYVDMLFNEVNSDLRNLTTVQFEAKYYKTRTPMGDGWEYRWRPSMRLTMRIHDTGGILTAWWN